MTEIDGYTDLEEIGRGGFAVVYKAQQVSVGRDVAIKLLTDPSPDDDLVRRFKRESKAVGALSWHPNIAAVVDAGSTDAGQAFIVFELLRGGSLEDRLAQAALSWQEAVASMIQVADAVEAAHRADVLHRDIKPANILLDRLGVAKLGDFGIASMQDGTKTETGMLATTVAHAAPELFDGRPSSAATDIYALGSTLHTLVTGRQPFHPAKGERIATTIAQIVHNPPPRPDEAIVPAEVSNVIAHALAKQPQYRPRSAAAFGQALQAAQRKLGERVTAMPVSDNEPAPPVKPTNTGPRETNKMVTRPAAAAAASGQPAPPSSGPAPAFGSVDQPAPPSAAPSAPDPTPAPTAEPSAGHAEQQRQSKPFSRLIAVLSVIAVLLAAGLGALLLFELQQGGEPAAQVETIGGARILSFDALDDTEMDFPFGEAGALDKDATTPWGIAPSADGSGIVGTSYVITLTKPQTITRVGITNANDPQFGRVSSIIWSTGFDDDDPTFEQEIPDQAGDFVGDFRVTTDKLTLVINGVHDEAQTAGIGELIIEVEQEPAAET